MDLPQVIAFCLAQKGVEETTPFGPEVLVYKVIGKMFAATDPDSFPSRINLKCDPDRALELREQYASVQPGWHMNKKHWNTIVLDGELPNDLVRELVEHSYELVVKGLTKAQRAELEN